LPRITSLRPNLSRNEAIEMFGRGLWRRLRWGPLRSVADFYVPFRIYSAEIENAGRRERRVIGIDAVNGSLDPYGFDTVPEPSELITLESRNVLAAKVEADAATRIAQHKLQRVMFQTGFFKVRQLRITLDEEMLLHVPYWVGFFGTDAYAGIATIDAVRRTMEGARVRRIVSDWLAAPP
jgi:hypothetical protein